MLKIVGSKIQKSRFFRYFQLGPTLIFLGSGVDPVSIKGVGYPKTAQEVVTYNPSNPTNPTYINILAVKCRFFDNE